MKRFLILLLISFVFVTGCSVKQINSKDINKTVDSILCKNLNLYNYSSGGYKYYLPRGMRVIDNTSYNEKLYSNGNAYYLYVDIVSYYFEKSSTYEKNTDLYFSKQIVCNNKTGYLEITKKDDSYFIDYVYNYAKIKAYVALGDIENAVINASYILSSLTFNDTIIDSYFGNDTLSYDEEKFELFESQRETGNFLDYVTEYDQYEKEIDEDLLVPDNTSTEDGTSGLTE
ncbi:MAG: hypothetical protein WC343_04775 [Bacilli bacterium]|jgi:hypothetical protein